MANGMRTQLQLQLQLTTLTPHAMLLRIILVIFIGLKRNEMRLMMG